MQEENKALQQMADCCDYLARCVSESTVSGCVYVCTSKYCQWLCVCMHNQVLSVVVCVCTISSSETFPFVFLNSINVINVKLQYGWLVIDLNALVSKISNGFHGPGYSMVC